jgi:hypothetical protein
MDAITLRLLAIRLGLPETSTEDEIDAFIAKASAKVAASRRSPYVSSTAAGDTRLGYGAPERPVPYGGEVTPSIAARDDAGRRVEPHPRGGFFQRVFAGRATASTEDEGLPWVDEPAGYPRVRRG